MLSPIRVRPISYSESHIDLPRIESNLKSLLQESHSASNLEIEMTPRPKIPTPPKRVSISHIHPSDKKAPKWLSWTLRFTLHLTLISLFEIIFFWVYISKSENNALIHLIGQYINGVIDQCPSLPVQNRQFLLDIVNGLLNQTIIDDMGISSYNSRETYNAVLLRKSWFYFGGLLSMFGGLSGYTYYKRYPIRWRKIVGENLVLILMLGLYEWLFFQTIVFQYKTITINELDRMIVDEIETACAI